jgi:alpha-glucosidase (family GH31 glycosyl hydrolase)
MKFYGKNYKQDFLVTFYSKHPKHPKHLYPKKFNNFQYISNLSAIGGRFEFFFLPGPTPEEVARQYQQIVGRPYLPAYWAFGYQVRTIKFVSYT